MDTLANNESFSADGRISRNEIASGLFEVSPTAFAWRIAVWLGLMVSGAAITTQGGWVWFVIGATVTGLGIAHGVELSHQALHNTGFRTPLANEIVGVALGLPMLVSFYEYRLTHLRHHAKVGTPEDTEFFDYGEDISVGRMIIERFLMTRHYVSYFAKLVRTLRGQPIGDFAPRHQFRLHLFYLISLSALASLLALCLIADTPKPLLFWLFALLVIATPIHALIEFPEHYMCSRTTSDVMTNTRTLTSNRLMRWFTNSNNFHVEHHYFPTLPLQNAFLVHKQFKPHIRYWSSGYRAFYREAIRAHFAGSQGKES
jgi:fatty acid desaturase